MNEGDRILDGLMLLTMAARASRSKDPARVRQAIATIAKEDNLACVYAVMKYATLISLAVKGTDFEDIPKEIRALLGLPV